LGWRGRRLGYGHPHQGRHRISLANAESLSTPYFPVNNGINHAAHIVEWSTMLRPNGSWGTCIPQGMLHSFNALHGAPFDFPILRVARAFASGSAVALSAAALIASLLRPAGGHQRGPTPGVGTSGSSGWWKRPLNFPILQIGLDDLLIVSIALAHRATLITRNVQHFRRVPGLIVVNWVDERLLRSSCLLCMGPSVRSQPVRSAAHQGTGSLVHCLLMPGSLPH
jgi:hypothetical protein